MQKPLISIILPVYRVEKYIQECLNSIINQDYTGDMECIIIDDCGGDSSMSIIEDFLIHYTGPIHFKIVHHLRNRGLSAARNTGIGEAKGEYLLFVDSDDEITFNAITSLTKPLAHGRYDFIIGDYMLKGSDLPYPELLLNDGCTLSDNEIFRSYLLGQWYMMAVNKLVNRDFIIEHHLYFLEGIIHEDDLWSFELSLKARSMYVTKEYCYVYKIREGSITSSAGIKRSFESRLIIRKKIYDIIENQNLKYNYELNNFLQNYDLSLLKIAKAEFGDGAFLDLYHNIRNQKIKKRDLIRANSLKLRKYLRDSHLFFSETIGRWMVDRIVNYYLKKRKFT